MAEGQHGGYRKPRNPAPASPPGALSRRTDGGPGQPVRVAPGGAYGERAEMEGLQSSAPMAQSGSPSAPPAPRPTPLGAPTARPDEPITAGVPVGPGVGPQAAGILDDREMTNEKLRPLLASLNAIANLPGSNPETRTFVRLLRARLSE